MKTFKNGNWSSGAKCPICKSSKEGEIILLPKVGTNEGLNYEAIQVHVDCLADKLMYYPDNNIIAANCNQ